MIRSLASTFFVSVLLASSLNAQNPAWTELVPAGTLPPPRAAASLVYDGSTNQAILFGGGYPETGDLWRLSNANGTGGTPVWTQLFLSPSPAAREVQGAVYSASTSTMIVFGGGLGSTSPCVNDTWILTNATGVSGSPAWNQLHPTGPVPSVRGSFVAVYDDANNRMMIFGGDDCFPSNLYNEVWVLTNANGQGGTPAWVQLSPSGTLPPPTSQANGVYDPTSNTLMVFGGTQNNDNDIPTNNVWVLSHANGMGGSPAWTQLSPSGPLPAGRYAGGAVYDAATNQMTIFGGSNGITGPLNDTWVLSNANGLGGTPAWTQLNPVGNPAPAKYLLSSAYDPSTGTMMVFGGGDSNGNPTNDVWLLSNANGGGQPILAGNITGKNGPANDRSWTIQLTNNGTGTATVAQLTGLTLTQTLGVHCSPVVSSSFPILLGDIVPSGMSSAAVSIDFTGCAPTAMFTVNIPFSSNAGATNGYISRTKQVQ